MKVALWSQDGSVLEFTDGRLEDRGSWFRCNATLVVDGDATTVELGMITPYRNMWLEAFEEVAAADWSAERSWGSEHGELDLTFKRVESDGVSVDVRMCWPPDYDAERLASLLLTSDDLARAARALRAFLRLAR